MTIKRVREWSYPHVDELEGLLQWAKDHHREHMEEAVARVVDFTDELRLKVERVAPFGLDDDKATSWTPSNNIGVLIIHSGYQAKIDETAIVAYRVDASNASSLIASSAASNAEVTTGALTGTDGNDTKWTISAHTDGKIYVENRLGSTVWFRGTVVT